VCFDFGYGVFVLRERERERELSDGFGSWKLSVKIGW
jgi:hypothetical protein